MPIDIHPLRTATWITLMILMQLGGNVFATVYVLLIRRHFFRKRFFRHDLSGIPVSFFLFSDWFFNLHHYFLIFRFVNIWNQKIVKFFYNNLLGCGVTICREYDYQQWWRHRDTVAKNIWCQRITWSITTEDICTIKQSEPLLLALFSFKITETFAKNSVNSTKIHWKFSDCQNNLFNWRGYHSCRVRRFI